MSFMDEMVDFATEMTEKKAVNAIPVKVRVKTAKQLREDALFEAELARK